MTTRKTTRRKPSTVKRRPNGFSHIIARVQDARVERAAAKVARYQDSNSHALALREIASLTGNRTYAKALGLIDQLATVLGQMPVELSALQRAISSEVMEDARASLTPRQFGLLTRGR